MLMSFLGLNPHSGRTVGCLSGGCYVQHPVRVPLGAPLKDPPKGVLEEEPLNPKP